MSGLQKIRDSMDRDSKTSAKSSVELRAYYHEDVVVDINARLEALQEYMMANVDRWTQLNSEASGGDPSATWVIALFDSGVKFETVDVAETSVIAAWDSLIANANIPDFTARDKTAVLQLGKRTIKRHRAEGFNLPAPSDFTKSRSL